MIKLHVNVGRRFKAGAVIEDDALDAAFLGSLIEQGFAERLPGDDELPAELVAAIAAFSQQIPGLLHQGKVLIGLAVEAGPAGAAAVVAMFRGVEREVWDLEPVSRQLRELADQHPDEPDADDQRSGLSGSEPRGDAGSEASAGGGPTDAEISAANAATNDTEAKPGAPAPGEGIGQVTSGLVADAGGTGESPPANDPPAPQPAATTPRRQSGSKAKAKAK